MHASFSKHPQGTLCPLSLAFGWARLSVNHPPPHSGEGGARSSQENTHPPPPSKQCEKGKESSYWVGRFKTHECLFGQKNNCVNRFGTEWN